MKFTFFLILILSIFTLNRVNSNPNTFKEKSCGKAIMARFWALCPSGINANDPRQLYMATLMCGVGFTDQEIQSAMCPQQLGTDSLAPN